MTTDATAPQEQTPPTTGTPAEPTHPVPPRFWWLTRLSALIVLLAVALGGARWWWGNVAQAAIDAEIAGAHGRGEKILITDYPRRRSLPDDRNAAVLLRKAETALKLDTTLDWAVDNASVLPLHEDIAGFVDQAVKDNAAVLADVRAARELGQADWGVNIVSPMWSVLLPHLNPARNLARFTRAAALNAADRGDHAAALEHVRDVQAIAQSLEDGNLFLITHLVRLGIEALAVDAVGEIATDLQIAGGSNPPPTTRPAAAPATREQVREMIAQLLDDGPRRKSLHEALQGERAAQVDIGLMVARRARLVRPAIELDTLRMMKDGRQSLTAASATNWPASRKQLPVPTKVEGPRLTAHAVSQAIQPALGRAGMTSIRATAQSRLAAAALAIRLYQHDHAGQRPSTLAALVPDYLPAVPVDPFASAGEPIGYVADPLAPYVYSVGENGADDSGDKVTPWRPDATTTDPKKSLDLILRLTRVNAPPPEISERPPEETPPPTSAPTTGPS